MARAIALYALLSLLACHRTRALSLEAGAGPVDASDPSSAPVTPDAGHKLGSSYPPSTFTAGANISLTGNPPTCVGGCTVAATGIPTVPACSNFQIIEHDNASGFQCGPAPGTNGNFVKDNGTSWQSAAIGAGTGITVTAGSVALSTPVSVANGGTGDTSLTTSNLLLGAGTSPVTFLAPGPSGNLACSNGSTWTTACLPLGPGQGATGVSNPTAHSVALSEGSSNFTFLNGASGTVLVGNGAGADPSFAASTSVGGILQTANAYVSLVNIGTAQSIGSIALTVGSGQKARIWCTVSLNSTDATGHTVRLDITGGGLTSGSPNRVEVSLGNLVTGIVGASEAAALQATDTSAGSNTYTATISKVDSNTVTGQLVDTGGVLRGDVTAN